jgi:glycine dehydrogenase subunit 1
MRYIPSSPDERAEMLREIGLETVAHLFRSIPGPLRLREPLDLPPPQSEADLLRYLRELAARNATPGTHAIFLGAGAYHHFIPAHIDTLISRSEFYTSYTPYQPEISQGTLQAIFEYQTMICQITGMDVANASLYDGSTAMAEAILMAARVTGRPKMLLAASTHPHYREVARTYTRTLGIDLSPLDYDPTTGGVDPRSVQVDDSVAAVVVQSPNFFGCVEDIEPFARAAHAAGALMVVVITEPISLGLLQSPGAAGADIVAGEGQSFGIPISFGGPYLGLFATREKFLRQMPGRLAGQAFDQHGRRGFVLTLSTREQHIRREKATSNICTNQGLFMLMATIYLATMGRRGLQEVARQNLQKAAYAADQIARLKGYQLRFTGPRFNEFVVKTRRPVAETLEHLQQKKIVGGLALDRFHPELTDCLLVCLTEMMPRAEIDRFVAALDEL